MAKTHDASWACVSPPSDPTVKGDCDRPGGGEGQSDDPVGYIGHAQVTEELAHPGGADPRAFQQRLRTPEPQRLPRGARRAGSGGIAAFWLLGTAAKDRRPGVGTPGRRPCRSRGAGTDCRAVVLTCAGLPWRGRSHRPLLRRPGRPCAAAGSSISSGLTAEAMSSAL